MNRNTTIVLVVLFAALLLYVLLVQVPKDRQAAATPTVGQNPAGETLWPITADQVRGVRVVEPASGRSVAFSQDAQGVWSVTEPQAQAADQAAAASAASSFATLPVLTTLTTTTDLSAYGVLSPTYVLEATLADGSGRSATVGSEAASGDGYYVLRDGQLVIVSTFYIDALAAYLDSPPVPATPTPAASEAAPAAGTPATATPATGTPGTASPPAGPSATLPATATRPPAATATATAAP